MNIRRLKYFISVADKLSFTRAAEECYVAETVISRNIAVLEDEIGFKVFNRSNRYVELTPAGEDFYREAKNIVACFEKAVRNGQDIAAKNKKILTVGFISLFERLVLSEVLKEFSKLDPDVYLRIRQSTYHAIMEDIKTDQLDIAFFVPPYNVEPPPWMEIKAAYEEPFCVALSKDHPLAACEKLTLEMLAEERVIVNYPQWENTNVFERNKKIYMDFGFDETKIVPCTGGVEMALTLVELNQGIYLVTSSMRDRLVDTVVFIDVDDTFPKCEFVVAYSKSNKKKGLRSFLNFIDSKEEFKYAH